MQPNEIFIPQLPEVDMEEVKRQLINEIHRLEQQAQDDLKNPAFKGDPVPTTHELIEQLIDEIKDYPGAYANDLAKYIEVMERWHLNHAFIYMLNRSYASHDVERDALRIQN